MIAEGRSINVTLIFSLERYDEVIEAYLAGLEAADGRPRPGSSSVASRSSSAGSTPRSTAASTRSAPPRRWPSRARPPSPRPSSPTSCSSSTFSGPRWEALAARGARVQRPLWASTSTKNPAYPDTLYVDKLIGPDTVNTMPDATLEAFDDHGTLARTVDADLDEAQAVLDELADVGVDLDDVARMLEDEGVASFSKSFDELLGALEAKAAELGDGSGLAPRRARRARRRRRRPRRVRGAGHRGLPRPARTTASRWPLSGGDTARALLRAPGRRRRHARSTGGRSTSTGATSAACPTTTPTRTTAWPARRCSTGSAPPTPPTRCAARRAPTRTSSASASSAGSTSSTSASVPTATPPRCSPARRPSTPTPAGLS